MPAFLQAEFQAPLKSPILPSPSLSGKTYEINKVGQDIPSFLGALVIFIPFFLNAASINTSEFLRRDIGEGSEFLSPSVDLMDK
jgi:hypothetical protein